MKFDIQAYLSDKGIPFSSSGKNTSSGWINIQCPFCDDNTNHLGINLSLLIIHCWKCPTKGNIRKLVQKLEGSNSMARDVMAQYMVEDYDKDLRYDIKKRLSPPGAIMPTECVDIMPENFKDLLYNRRYNPDELIRKYKLKACMNGDFRNRIIIPVIVDSVIVNFTGLDVTGAKSNKYKHCPNDKAIMPMKDCLYNIDTVTDTALIVEGVTDVWRVGDGTVATMGIEYTKAQLALLVERGVKKAFVLYDAEDLAQLRANELATALSGVMPYVEVLELQEGDPDDMSNDQVKIIREIVFGF